VTEKTDEGGEDEREDGFLEQETPRDDSCGHGLVLSISRFSCTELDVLRVKYINYITKLLKSQ
jgi:hypothetical protein